MFSNQNYFDSYGLPPVNIIEQRKSGLYSKNQIQKNDSFCAAYCLYVLYLTNINCFESAVLNLNYQNLCVINEEK